MALEDPAVYGFAPAPTTASLRKVIDAVLPTDSDLEAFCIDFFPKIKKRFSNAMERRIKVTLLLEQENTVIIVHALESYNSQAMSMHRHLLQFTNNLTNKLIFDTEEVTLIKNSRKPFSIEAFFEAHPMLMHWLICLIFPALMMIMIKCTH